MVSTVPDGVSAWTREACRRVVRDLRDSGHPASHVYGFAPWPDHSNRRCIDFMLPTVREVRWVRAYVVRHAVQLRARYVIADRMQWRSYRKGLIPPRTWVPYFGKSPHRDHVHVEFDA
jgi:hypothetical protein